MKTKIKNLLRWSEKYTKTDMVYLVRGSFWLFLSKGINSIASLLITITLANFLSPENYGSFKFIMSYMGIFAIFSLQGFDESLIQSVAQGSEGNIKRTYKLRTRFSLIGSIGILVLASYYIIKHNYTLGLSFSMMAIFFPLLFSSETYRAMLNGKRLFKKVSFSELFIHSISVISIVLVAYITHNLIYVILTYLVTYSLSRTLVYFYHIKNTKWNDNKDDKSFSFGKHLSLMGVLSKIASEIDKIILFHFMGALETAVYAISTSLPREISNLLANIKTLALPKFTNRSPEEIKKDLFRKSFGLFLLSLSIVALYIFFAPLIFKLLFPEYVEYVKYTQVFSLFLLLTPKMILSTVLTSQVKQKELYMLRSIVPLMKIIGFIVLFPLFGLWGGILSLILVEVIEFFILVYFVKRLK